jgi:hypothetical protein
LGFFLLLAVVASKAIGHDTRALQAWLGHKLLALAIWVIWGMVVGI